MLIANFERYLKLDWNRKCREYTETQHSKTWVGNQFVVFKSGIEKHLMCNNVMNVIFFQVSMYSWAMSLSSVWSELILKINFKINTAATWINTQKKTLPLNSTFVIENEKWI